MKIYLASDHAGYDLKEKLKPYLSSLGHEVLDMGNVLYEETDDYPDFIIPLAKTVALDPNNCRGIILGGSGQGEAMAANRVLGARAIVIYSYNEKIIELSREHNDANIISFGAWFISEDLAKQSLKLWLETPFSKEERHTKRIKKIDELV